MVSAWKDFSPENPGLSPTAESILIIDLRNLKKANEVMFNTVRESFHRASRTNEHFTAKTSPDLDLNIVF